MGNEGHFTILDPDECRHLLRNMRAGRVSWNSPTAGQLILPVNYAVVDETIIFRTSPRAILAQLTEGHEVAFEVDEFDEEASNGWSVLVQGTSELYCNEVNPLARPWAPGVRNLVVAINPTHYSGRAVSAGDTDPA